jgi:hypothetical protein
MTVTDPEHEAALRRAVEHDDTTGLDESWHEVDLRPYLRGDVAEVVPTVLRRDDGACLLYAGRVNGLHGDSGIGKSFAAEVAAVQELADGRHVVWIDFEDPDPITLIIRMRQLGAADQGMDDRLHYYGPKDAFTAEAVEVFENVLRYYDVTLVVIDSLGEAFGLEGIDENKDPEVGPWMRRVARRLADLGPAVAVIDHSTKSPDNPLHPSGSKRKRAAITGASYLVEAPVPLTRESGGRLRLTCAKDRHGHYRRGAVVANIEFTAYPDGGITEHVWSPMPSDEQASTPSGALLLVATKAIRAVKDAERPLTQNGIIERMNAKARLTTKRAAIEEAVALGALRAEDGPRGSTLHHYVHDLESPT